MIGIWINWPGMWITDGLGDPMVFDTEAEARAWAEENGFHADALEFKQV